MGWDKKFGNEYYAKTGIVAGAVTGYEDKLTPMVMPRLAFGAKNKGELGLMYAPKQEGKNPATLMMNYSVPIK